MNHIRCPVIRDFVVRFFVKGIRGDFVKKLFMLIVGLVLLPITAFASIETHPNTIGVDWAGNPKQTWTEFFQSERICLSISNESLVVTTDNLALHKMAWVAHVQKNKVEIKLHELSYEGARIRIRELAIFTSEGQQILPGVGRLNCLAGEWRDVKSEEDKAISEKVWAW